MGLRNGIARMLAPMIAATAMVPVTAGLVGGIAFAGTCSPSDKDLEISTATKNAVFTHEFEVATLEPGGYMSVGLTWQRSYTSTVTGTGSATFSAGVILASAETKFSLSLADANTKSTTTSVTVGVTNNTSSTLRYIFFRGLTTVVATWKEYHCYAGTEKLYASGTLSSWALQHSGVVRCDKDATYLSQFGSNSLEYRSSTKC